MDQEELNEFIEQNKMEKEIDEDWNYITKKKKKSTISNLISFIKRIIWHKQK